MKIAKELAPKGIEVDAVDPGLTRTDLGGPIASQPPEDAAAIAVKMATISDFRPTGGFFHNRDAQACRRNIAGNAGNANVPDVRFPPEPDIGRSAGANVRFRPIADVKIA